jgi:ABC-type lipoprotein release transport system permease subunit
VGRLISSLLFGVEPLDLSTFGSAALLLMLTAAIATAVPALRATRVDPAVTFRNE